MNQHAHDILAVDCAGISGCVLLATSSLEPFASSGGKCRDFGDGSAHKLHEGMRWSVSHFHWRSLVKPLIARLARHHANGSLAGDVYEFGVFGGASMSFFRKELGDEPAFWGFDSFHGLPPDTAEAFQQANFQAGMHRWGGNPSKLQKSLGKNTRLIAGFYNESLRSGVSQHRHMRSAAYVDIDADLYVSTLEALHWMARSKLLVPGTLVGYDDFWASPCSAGGEHVLPLETGEGRAHREIAHKHHIRFRCVAGACDPTLCSAMVWGPIFRVESVGIEAHTGFTLSTKEQNEWRAHSEVCKIKHNMSDHRVFAPVSRQHGVSSGTAGASKRTGAPPHRSMGKSPR